MVWLLEGTMRIPYRIVSNDERENHWFAICERIARCEAEI